MGNEERYGHIITKPGEGGLDIPLLEPDDVPVPPADVRFRAVEVAPLPDGRRLRVRLVLTPFMERPNVDLLVQDRQGSPLASVAIVETNDPSMQLTVHLPPAPPVGPLTLVSVIHYEIQGPVDRRETTFETS